jgi:hypothetical protein
MIHLFGEVVAPVALFETKNEDETQEKHRHEKDTRPQNNLGLSPRGRARAVLPEKVKKASSCGRGRRTDLRPYERSAAGVIHKSSKRNAGAKNRREEHEFSGIGTNFIIYHFHFAVSLE